MASFTSQQLPHSFPELDTIIFDLGGVLYDISYERIEEAFGKLQTSSGDPVHYSRQTQPDVVTAIEVGDISPEEFYEGFRKDFLLAATDEQILEAWNSMLVKVFDGRAEMVQRLHERYSLALLSNTNILHHNHIAEECAEMFSHFDYLFMSYQMRKRKPNVDIFEDVLTQTGFAPERTLFIDDSPQHLEGAAKVGLHTIWLQSPDVLPLIAEMLVVK
jgi:putative hydrolase of the HAD superfamily